MKIVAVSDRGSRKDFIDLYAISTRAWPLAEALDNLPRKFGERYSLAHILRSLQYFEDAEREPELRLLDPSISWPEVKRFFRDQVLAYMRRPAGEGERFGSVACGGFGLAPGEFFGRRNCGLSRPT
jgi:hypothetical protein